MHLQKQIQSLNCVENTVPYTDIFIPTYTYTHTSDILAFMFMSHDINYSLIKTNHGNGTSMGVAAAGDVGDATPTL